MAFHNYAINPPSSSDRPCGIDASGSIMAENPSLTANMANNMVSLALVQDLWLRLHDSEHDRINQSSGLLRVSRSVEPQIDAADHAGCHDTTVVGTLAY